MGLKKFLAIPALVIFYVYFINFMVYSGLFPSLSSLSPTGQAASAQTGNAVDVSMGQGAYVEVTRPYFFGLITLPVFTSTIGDISIIHDIFFGFMAFITVIFILTELRSRKRKKLGLSQ